MPTHSTWVRMSHDGFARETLIRRTVETDETCWQCGSVRRSGRLFEYAIEPDGIGAKRFTLEGLFCGNGCRKTYHGLD